MNWEAVDAVHNNNAATVERLTSLKGKLEDTLREIRFHHSMEELAQKHGKDAPNCYDAELQRTLTTLIHEAQAVLDYYQG